MQWRSGDYSCRKRPVSHLPSELGEEGGHCYQDAMIPWEAEEENLS